MGSYSGPYLFRTLVVSLIVTLIPLCEGSLARAKIEESKP